MSYSYHGNIRELENIIEYGFILCPGGYIQESHLPGTYAASGPPWKHRNHYGLTPGMTLEDIERQAIYQSLERNQWKRMLTCRELQFLRTPCAERSNITICIIPPNRGKGKDSGQKTDRGIQGRGRRIERDTACPAPSSAGLALCLGFTAMASCCSFSRSTRSFCRASNSAAGSPATLRLRGKARSTTASQLHQVSRGQPVIS